MKHLVPIWYQTSTIRYQSRIPPQRPCQCMWRKINPGMFKSKLIPQLEYTK